MGRRVLGIGDQMQPQQLSGSPGELRAAGTRLRRRHLGAPLATQGRRAGAAASNEMDLSNRVRAHLEGLNENDAPITYGALARALGLWAPGSVGKVTRALETTMRQDAAADRPFIAARVVNRGHGNLPGKGYFDLASALSRGPLDGEIELDAYARELHRLNETKAKSTTAAAVPEN